MYEIIVALEDDEKEISHVKKIVTPPFKKELQVEQSFMILEKKSLKCKMRLCKFKKLYGILKANFMI